MIRPEMETIDLAIAPHKASGSLFHMETSSQMQNGLSSPSAGNYYTTPIKFSDLENTFSASLMSTLSSKPRTVVQAAPHQAETTDIFSQDGIHIDLGISPNSEPGIDALLPALSPDWIMNNSSKSGELQDSLYKRLSTRSFFDAGTAATKSRDEIDIDARSADANGQVSGGMGDLPSPLSPSTDKSSTIEYMDETTEPSQKRKRGRPRLIAQHEQTDRRRAQIRDAQRTYRQKKDRTITDLQSRVDMLESTIERMQSVFLDVYEHGVQVAVQQEDPMFVHTLADASSKILALTRAAITDQGGSPFARIESASSDSSDPDTSTSSPCLVPTRMVTPAKLMRDALSCSVADRAGPTFSDKLIEAIYRMCFTIARHTIESGDRDAIERIFPEGLDSEVMLPGLNNLLRSKDRIYLQTWRGRVDDDSLYPGYLSPASIATRVARFEDSMEGPDKVMIDGDALVAWLYGRGQCLGRTPRFKTIDVDIGLLMARHVVSA
ncbi:hypothetical protein V1517DRAFT_321858 [Lipomyces orientalis]|uniref:Uncharacterized protein n=1 Tax=Lipomyces orientalis TaxID=1233043 RepID=A0ACC3TP74_9ASCO